MPETRELAYRDAVARGTGVWGLAPKWNTVCPRSGPVTHQPEQPKTMANVPEMDNTT
jgi:hypothetical protein